MFKSIVRGRAAECLAELRDAAVELVAHLMKKSRSDAPEREGEAQARKDSAVVNLELAAADTESRLSQLAVAACDADRIKRVFQSDNNLFRDLKHPDMLMTALLVMLGWLVESVFTTVGLFADGHLDLIPAMGFSVTFSTVNVGLGLSAGFCIRYFGYRRYSSEPRREHRLVRNLATTGLLMLIGLDAMMIFVGGRVRVTGSHDGIFDFSEVSFGATFGDGLALVIMIAAGLSFAISTFKGYSGFVDPVPGYADHAGRETAGFDDEAEEITLAAQERIDYILEDAEDDILDLLDDPEDDMAFLEDVLSFNADVQNAKDQVRVFAQSEWERRSFVEGKPIPRSALNVDTFDTLLIEPDAVVHARPQNAVLEELRQAHAEASARIGTARTNYLARTRRIHIPTSNI